MTPDGGDGTPGVGDSADPVARLLRQAGQRRRMPRDAERRLHAHVHAGWKAAVARRRRVRRLGVAAAAALVVGILVGLLQLPFGASAQVVAAIGGDPEQVQVERSGRVVPGARELRIADRLVVTGRRGGVLRTTGVAGVELRLAPGSRIEWTGARELRLIDGSIYLDAAGQSGGGRPGADGALRVRAGAASVEHVGTRYLARVAHGATRVAVREGLVRIEAEGSSTLLMSGEVGEVSAAGQLTRSVGRSSPAEWRWVEALSPPLQIEGRPLADVIPELAREAGLTVEFADAEVAQAARDAVLHGPALELAPQEALRAVIATSGFGVVPLPVRTGSESPEGLRITRQP